MPTNEGWGNFFEAVSTHTIRHVVAAAKADSLDAIVNAVNQFDFNGLRQGAQVARLLAVTDGLCQVKGAGLELAERLIPSVKNLPESDQLKFVKLLEKHLKVDSRDKFVGWLEKGFGAAFAAKFSESRAPHDSKTGHGDAPAGELHSDVIAGNLIYRELNIATGQIDSKTIKKICGDLQDESNEMIRSVTLGILQALPKDEKKATDSAGLQAFRGVFAAASPGRTDGKRESTNPVANEIVRTTVAFLDDPTTSEEAGVAKLVAAFQIDKTQAQGLVKANRKAFLAEATRGWDAKVESAQDGKIFQIASKGSAKQAESKALPQLPVAPSPPVSPVSGDGSESSSPPPIATVNADDFIHGNKRSEAEWLKYGGSELGKKLGQRLAAKGGGVEDCTRKALSVGEGKRQWALDFFRAFGAELISREDLKAAVRQSMGSANISKGKQYAEYWSAFNGVPVESKPAERKSGAFRLPSL